MTTAKLPDGTTLNFPDETPPDVIQRAVKQQLAQQGPSVGSQLKDIAGRQAGLTGRYLIEGAMTVPNAIGDAANTVLNMGLDAANKVGVPIDYRFPMMSATTEDALDKGFPKPETAVEKGASIGSQILTSGPGLVPAAKALDVMGVKGLEPLMQYGGVPWLNSGKDAAKALTTEQIKAAAQQAYKASEDAGLVLGPKPLQSVLSDAQAKLAELGYRPALQPKIATALEELSKDAAAGNVTLKGVDGLRQVMLNIARDGNPSERMMAGKIISRIDDQMANLSPDDVVMGNADEGLQQLGRARQLWRTQAKSDLIDSMMKKATDQASTTNSGGNLQNKMRQQFAKILNSPKQTRLFSADERAAMQQIVDGTWTQNTLRTIGRLAPSSNSWLGPMMAVMGGGSAAATGGDLLATAGAAAIPAIGAAAKGLATRSTGKDIAQLSKLIRSAASPQVSYLPEPPQAAMARLLAQGSAVIPGSPYARALLGQPVAAAGQPNGTPSTGFQGQP